MELDTKQRLGLAAGALIGAVLGAGSAFLLLTAPDDSEESEEFEREPITGGELLSLTSTAAVLIRKVDNLRRQFK